jgi:hypothetical protein
MALIQVHRFRVYDITSDDYVTSTRLATKEKIVSIRGEIIPGTEASVGVEFVKDGWTAKNFDPVIDTLMHRARELADSLQKTLPDPSDPSN